MIQFPNIRITLAALAWVFAALGALAAGQRIPWTTSKIVGTPDPPPLVRADRVFPSLQFREATDLVYDESGQQWFVSELAGRILSFPAGLEKSTNAINVVVDLAQVHQPFEQLLGITLDPGFQTNHWIYAAYCTHSKPLNRSRGSHLVRMRLDDSLKVVSGSESELLAWPGGGHNGCCLKFGPDGMLYISTGDGDSPEPPDAGLTGQNLTDFLSCILRIDVHPVVPGRPYEIPDDNPFMHWPGARPEIWAYGFRNPWRMSFDPDGSLWVGDVGWELWETVHRATAGYNAGWSRVEGPQMIHAEVQPPTPISEPVIMHPHSEAASITGGWIYRGRKLGTLGGAYLYGDWDSGKIWALRLTNGNLGWHREIVDTPYHIVAFAPGPDHELYLLDHRTDGGIYRLEPVSAGVASGAFPRRLSETGLFSDTAAGKVAAGVEAYAVEAPPWQDHAVAQRWVAVPGDVPIRAGEHWEMPAGTVWMKTLSSGQEGKTAGSQQPIETQLLHFDGADWHGYSYRWNESATDADLVDAQGEDRWPARRGAGSPPETVTGHRWRFASRAECLRCHNSWSGFALGFNSVQLGREIPRLAARGVIQTNGWTAPDVVLANPYQAGTNLTVRARSWLHANCAPCHRWGAGGAVAAYFPIEEPLEKLRLVDARPNRGEFGIPDARILAPGHPEHSVLWYRMNSKGSGHMPLIGPAEIDVGGSRLVADWIRSLAPAPRVEPGPDPRSTAEALSVLDAVLPGEPPAQIVTNALASNNSMVRDLFSRFAPGGGIDASTTFEPGEVLRLTGDPARGDEVLHRGNGPNCLRCHQLNSEGVAFGPELSTTARRLDNAQLLLHILQPSLSVAPEFALHALELNDGTSLMGLVKPHDAQTVEVVANPGDSKMVPRNTIRKDERLRESAMPEGLLSSLTAQEVADLLARLRKSSQQ